MHYEPPRDGERQAADGRNSTGPEDSDDAPTSGLGACPVCGAALASRDVLIEYERRGQPAVYAECPGCQEVVSPA